MRHMALGALRDLFRVVGNVAMGSACLAAGHFETCCVFGKLLKRPVTSQALIFWGIALQSQPKSSEGQKESEH